VDKNPNRNARHPAVVLQSNNNPIINWDQQDLISQNVYVKQF
jgi:hypothetical protein